MTTLNNQDPFKTTEQTFQEAIRLHLAGNLLEAGRLYRSVLESDPGHPDATHNLGVLAVQNNQPDAGLPFFKAALEADPGMAQYWLSCIDALIQTGQHRQALQLMEEGKRQGLAGVVTETLEQRLTGPSAVEISELAALFNQGQYGEAEGSARALTACFPLHGFAWKALGAALMAQGQTAEALEAMQKSAELSPLDAEVHSNLGNSLMATGRLSEAEASCRRALEINPDYAEAHFNLGNALTNQRRLSAAEACYARALEIRPDFAEADYGLRSVRKELARLAEAEARIRSEKENRLLISGVEFSKPARFNLLDFCRKHKDRAAGKLIGLLGGVLFLGGMMLMWDRIDPGGPKASGYAVRVDASEISLTTFSNNYDRNREFYRKKYAAAFTPELEARLALRQATLDALVNNELLYNAAVRQGLKVSDEEVIRSIASMPVFQKNGVFDLELYKQILARNNRSPKLFEQAQRKDLMAEKARQAVINSVQVTDQQLKELYLKEYASSSKVDYEGLKEELKRRLAPGMQQNALNKWLAEQRASARIEISKQISAAISKENNANAARP